MMDDEIDDEVDALIQYLETERGLSEPMACSIMGMAIRCLIRDNALVARGFVRTLAEVLNVADELRAPS